MTRERYSTLSVEERADKRCIHGCFGCSDAEGPWWDCHVHGRGCGPECIPTPDPMSFAMVVETGGYVYRTSRPTDGYEYAPRPWGTFIPDREAAPENRLMVAFRLMHGGKGWEKRAIGAAAWLASLRDMTIAGAWSVEEAELARPILMRLARWS